MVGSTEYSADLVHISDRVILSSGAVYCVQAAVDSPGGIPGGNFACAGRAAAYRQRYLDRDFGAAADSFGVGRAGGDCVDDYVSICVPGGAVGDECVSHCAADGCAWHDSAQF